MNPFPERVAYFVTSHGFGHAARACAVISALHNLQPELQVDIFSATPQWFFESSLSGPYTCHDLVTDIGLVQSTPLVEDLDATLKQLDGFLPFDDNLLDRVARILKKQQCSLIFCDISPLGISVGERAGIPTVLIENFTWNWIYEGYQTHQEGIAPHTLYLEQVFERATFHIQVEPFCGGLAGDLTTGPVCRSPRQSASKTKLQLNVPVSKKLVLITMGGIPESYRFQEDLHAFDSCIFLVPGNNEQIKVDQNLVLLPYQSAFYHPDLVNAADVVIGKVGYSTLAEVFHAGVPFGYFTRSGFRESDVLSGFVDEQMPGVRMPECAYNDGSWCAKLPELLDLQRMNREEANGAAAIADFIVNRTEG